MTGFLDNIKTGYICSMYNFSSCMLFASVGCISGCVAIPLVLSLEIFFSLCRFGSGNVFLIIPLPLHFHQFLARIDLGTNFFQMLNIK